MNDGRRSVPSVSVDDWIRFFDPASKHLTATFATIHASRDLPGRQRETAALALAQYWSDQPNQLVDAILIADEIAEFSPLFKALKPPRLTDSAAFTERDESQTT